jgi:acetyl-CoA carboxylase biotin carboxyl carrier protein
MNKKKAGAKISAEAGEARSRAADNGANLELVRELARIATEFDLSEIELKPSGRIRIARGATAMGGLTSTTPSVTPSLPSAAAPVVALPSAPPSAKEALTEEDGVFITSPFVGTFYRSPSPDTPPFVDVGQVIRKGQVVCIIEAMKLMNEIEAETAGKVLEVLAKNAEHVEYGQKLFRLAKV